jgi:DNA-binding response OmpR family regulator
MLPKLDGLSLIIKLRDDNINTPVLILSALGEVDEKVIGLKAGADDYLAKPFSFSELLARIEVLHRRASPDEKEVFIKVGNLTMNLLTREVHRSEIKIELQPQEFRLLEFLMRRSNQVVTRTMLLEGVWEYHFDPQTNVIDVHISRLRSKIDKPFKGDFYLKLIVSWLFERKAVSKVPMLNFLMVFDGESDIFYYNYKYRILNLYQTQNLFFETTLLIKLILNV